MLGRLKPKNGNTKVSKLLFAKNNIHNETKFPLWDKQVIAKPLNASVGRFVFMARILLLVNRFWLVIYVNHLVVHIFYAWVWLPRRCFYTKLLVVLHLNYKKCIKPS